MLFFFVCCTKLEGIQARALYRSGFEYKPQFTPIILCNDIPDFNKIDKAIEQRTHIIPFQNKFVEEPKMCNEKKINRTLIRELDNVEIFQSFIWILIYNYKNMDSSKVSYSSYVKTKEFIKEQNPLCGFIDECIKCEMGSNVQCKVVYEAYCNYSKEMNERIVNLVKFSRLMDYNGFEKEKCKANKIVYVNISIKLNNECN